MNCFFCTSAKKDVWTKGEVLGWSAVGHQMNAVVLPKDGVTAVPVELAHLSIGDEHPNDRAKRLKAVEDAAKAKVDKEAEDVAAVEATRANAQVVKAQTDAEKAAAAAEAAKLAAHPNPPPHQPFGVGSTHPTHPVHHGFGSGSVNPGFGGGSGNPGFTFGPG